MPRCPTTVRERSQSLYQHSSSKVYTFQDMRRRRSTAGTVTWQRRRGDPARATAAHAKSICIPITGSASTFFTNSKLGKEVTYSLWTVYAVLEKFSSFTVCLLLVVWTFLCILPEFAHSIPSFSYFMWFLAACLAKIYLLDHNENSCFGSPWSPAFRIIPLVYLQSFIVSEIWWIFCWPVKKTIFLQIIRDDKC